MKIVLYQPQIPQNTGNIVRTCSVTGTELILVRPLGFRLSDRLLKRAGLDYHNDTSITTIIDLEEFLQSQESFYFFSSKVTKKYTEVQYTKDSVLIFGSETSGLPDWIFEKYQDRFVTIPMLDNQRCLNLSNSVSIGIYEAWRQLDFA